MKVTLFILAVAALLAISLAGQSQGFVNLNFESAKIIPIVDNIYYPYAITSSNAVPGWIVTGYGSLTPTPWITYNAPALGSSAATLWATNGQQISGKYSMLLQGGLGPGISISQTGLVPSSTLSILFEAQESGVGTLQLSLGGQNLAFFAVGTGTNYTLFGATIPLGMGGQTEQLMFSALTVPSGYGFNNWNIDNIQFSSSPVPEPGVFGLVGLGVLAFGLGRRLGNPNCQLAGARRFPQAGRDV